MHYWLKRALNIWVSVNLVFNTLIQFQGAQIGELFYSITDLTNSIEECWNLIIGELYLCLQISVHSNSISACTKLGAHLY